ncbi:sulfatase-like hydrolase/transferase [Saliphagus sp. GCM10025308]
MNKPHVLLITVDSLRFDRCPRRPYGTVTAPNVAELSEEAITFSQAVSNGPATRSSFPSILTSTHPLAYGGYSYLDNARPFIAKTLAEEGFQTVGYHSNPHLGADENYDMGFSEFRDAAEGSESIASTKDFVERRLDTDTWLYKLLRRFWHYFTMSTGTSAYAKASSITENALSWIDTTWDGESSFFMWLHYMDVHYPFSPPNKYVEQNGDTPIPMSRTTELNGRMQEEPETLLEEDVDDLLTLYDGEVRFVDEQIGHIIEHLRNIGIYEETLLVITADHGEAFGEHDRFGHHPNLYDELLRVPLVIRVPGTDSRDVEQQVSLVDLGPTIYDIVDIPIPDNVQGTSFAPLLRGDTMDEPVALVTAKGGDRLACRTSHWKCFWRRDDETVELFDLRSDREEVMDVSTDNPEHVSRFKEIMEEYITEAEATDTDLPKMSKSDEVEERLKDLGYID